MVDNNQEVIEPSVLDKWMAARAGATGKGKSITHASLGLVFGILRDISVSVFTVRNIPPVLGITACSLIVWGILAIATGPTNLRKVNQMWDEHPSMRPHIMEAASDGIITRWENRNLGLTLREQTKESNHRSEQNELEHRMNKEK